MIGRRGLIAGLGALFAAPALVRAESLMKVAPTEIIKPDTGWYDGVRIRTVNNYLTIETNTFIKNLEADYRKDLEFYSGAQWDMEFWDETKVGSQLKIQLPNDFVVRPELPKIPIALGVAALAVAAGPVVEEALNKPVSRRFWGS